MSTEEQDLILGRLTRQSKEADRIVASIEAKVKGLAQDLSHSGGTISTLWVAVKPLDSIVAEIQNRLPERSDVLAALAELKTARAEADEFKRQLESVSP